MEVAIDKFGRIVIPKAVRDLLGLQAGAELSLEVNEREGGKHEIALRPVRQQSRLVQKGSVLVFHADRAEQTGELDAGEAVRAARQQREDDLKRIDG